MQYLCKTDGCPNYTGDKGGLCLQCREKNPELSEPADRNLLKCTVCGFEAGNRGALANHVRSAHANPEE